LHQIGDSERKSHGAFATPRFWRAIAGAVKGFQVSIEQHLSEDCLFHLILFQEQQRGVNAVLAETQVGPDRAELREQLSQRRRGLNGIVPLGSAQGAVPEVEDLVFLVVVTVRRQVRTLAIG